MDLDTDEVFRDDEDDPENEFFQNPIYNALRVAQGLLHKGSAKTADKRILLFTNEDDPFGSIKGAAETDMTRTTLQRAKDAQDLGISIELLPLHRPGEEFHVSLFNSFQLNSLVLGLPAVDLSNVILKLKNLGHKVAAHPLNYHMNIRSFETPGTINYATLFILLISLTSGLGLEDTKDQLRKRMFTKRIVKRISFIIANGLSRELNSYALICPTVPGATTWLDSVTNCPLKVNPLFTLCFVHYICAYIGLCCIL
ncbi:hypothetical protein Pint_04801 [Pistacia integerrima]|uniref:Uncharacterized protein n=1 Tax=Pistacia integerrima TaxID=434235 RepID=A0ACC0ZA85_9ROSI|nr:hypothetical protein Pint_04801 [Pistacia integerrima]